MYLLNDVFIDCDPSCKDCYGDGNDMCYNCAQGYVMKDKKCIGIIFILIS